ncbi:MAG: LptF/LptG family permease [Spirochaetia bacterium]|nr:LptF/LptG family permease [Spirochaetia bacterium]
MGKVASVPLEYELLQRGKAEYSLARYYVSRQYLLSFCAAFVFFFMIFFVNQILLLAKQIPMNKIAPDSLFTLVLLAIPQFLLYTFPFATLTGASMVIGEFTSTNEILALRSVGYSLRRIYAPIICISIVLSCTTFLVADMLLPYSAVQYRKLYTHLMSSLPTLEVKSNSSNSIGDVIISNGHVEGQTINDLVIMQKQSNGDDQLLGAAKGTLALVDPLNFIYMLDLENPNLMVTRKNSLEDWSVAKGKHARLFLDFSSQVPSMGTNAPSNLSTVDLLAKIRKNSKALQEDVQDWRKDLRQASDELAFGLSDAATGRKQLVSDYQHFKSLGKKRPEDFYLQYFRAELQKKFALSAACFFLVFIAFPLSFVKFRHGRLLGFAISMLVAVSYWYLLFFAQLQVFSHMVNPLFWIWMPNALMFVLAMVLLKIRRMT